MRRKTNHNNMLPWFKFWTGIFKSKTDHLSNAEAGAYVRLLASYWDNNGLPFHERALTRIAKIEDGDGVDLGAILGEFFIVKDGTLHHEELDALRIEAIGEEDANRRRTLRARLALAEQRQSVTIPATETEVEVDVEGEEDPEPELEEDPHPDRRPRDQTNTQTGDPDPQPEAHQDAGLLQVTGDSDCQSPAQTAPTSGRQGESLRPDGEAQSRAVPAASSAPSGISFRLKDGSSIPLSAFFDQRQLSDKALGTLKQLAERFVIFPEYRVTADELPSVMKQWLQPLRRAG